MNNFITGCIVLYQNDNEQLEKLLHSFYNRDPIVHIFLIDNSPTDKLKVFANYPNITYIHNSLNLFLKSYQNFLLNNLKHILVI